jgi:hypothetical protein
MCLIDAVEERSGISRVPTVPARAAPSAPLAAAGPSAPLRNVITPDDFEDVRIPFYFSQTREI